MKAYGAAISADANQQRAKSQREHVWCNGGAEYKAVGSGDGGRVEDCVHAIADVVDVSVVACATREQIVAHPPGEHVAKIATGDGVVTGTAEECVRISGKAPEHIAGGTGVNGQPGLGELPGTQVGVIRKLQRKPLRVSVRVPALHPQLIATVRVRDQQIDTGARHRQVGSADAGAHPERTQEARIRNCAHAASQREAQRPECGSCNFGLQLRTE